MARIPEAEIERIKREVAVERLAEARGVVLERRGADLVGLCPFHEDREPSLVITPAKNLWHSLGACQAGGSAIDWVMRAEGVSFRHAVELLLADYQPTASSAAAGAVKRSTVVKLPTALERDAGDARRYTPPSTLHCDPGSSSAITRVLGIDAAGGRVGHH